MFTALAAQNWAMFVLRGVLALALGVLAFAAPGPTLAALIFVFAFYAIFDGSSPRAGPRVSDGTPLAARRRRHCRHRHRRVHRCQPAGHDVALVLLIGSFLIVRGVAEVGTVIWLRNIIESPWLYVLNGVVSIAFGVYLIALPLTGRSRCCSSSASTPSSRA